MTISKKRKFFNKAVFFLSIKLNIKHRSEILVSTDEKNRFGEKERCAKYEEMELFAKDIINKKLQDEYKQFNIPVPEIKVRRIYEKSTESSLDVQIDMGDVVLGINALYNIIKILKCLEILGFIVDERFKEKYGDDFDIDVTCKIPNDVQYWHDVFSILSNRLFISNIVLYILLFVNY